MRNAFSTKPKHYSHVNLRQLRAQTSTIAREKWADTKVHIISVIFASKKFNFCEVCGVFFGCCSVHLISFNYMSLTRR